MSSITVIKNTTQHVSNETLNENTLVSNDLESNDKVSVNKKKKTRLFETYISKVLKQITDKNGITSNCKQQLNSALCIIARNI